VATDLSAHVKLSLLPLSHKRSVGEQLRAGTPPATIFDQFLEQSPDQLDTHRRIEERAARALRIAQHDGVTAVPWGDPAYPPALAAIFDPPPILWVRGDAQALGAPAVAIVGSRAGSPYALAVAERLAADLAAHGVVVVSGLARGVDSAAHRGALSGAAAAGHGATVAVLGSGVDVVYPAEHRALAREIAQAGAIVSELVPRTPPRPVFFPLRNRIISGVSRAVVVIEAGERSGSLITARCALEQGRDVLAVPGNVLSGRNRGAHALLRDGAKIVETADDILEELRLPSTPPVAGTSGDEEATGADRVLAALLPGEECGLDLIAERAALAPSRVLTRLFELEMQGLVGRAGGGRFIRFDRPC
jgi:DNA processing protein